MRENFPSNIFFDLQEKDLQMGARIVVGTLKKTLLRPHPFACLVSLQSRTGNTCLEGKLRTSNYLRPLLEYLYDLRCHCSGHPFVYSYALDSLGTVWACGQLDREGRLQASHFLRQQDKLFIQTSKYFLRLSQQCIQLQIGSTRKDDLREDK